MMNIVQRYWDGLKRSFTPANGYTEPVFLYLGGEDRDAAAPSYLTTSITVMQCNRLRAQLLSSLPLKAYKVSKSGKKTEVTSGALVELLQKVNPFWTASRLLEMTEMSLGVFDLGCFWFVNKDRSGTPKEIWWARSDLVTVKRSNSEYISYFEYQVPNSGQIIRFERDEVIWFRYPNPGNEFSSLTPLRSAMLAADTSYAAMVSNRLMFKNGMQVAGVIGPPENKSFTQEQANDLEEGVSRRFRGADKAHRWMVMRYDIKFQPSTVTPKDAEFLGTLQWGKEEIANAYGVPLDMIGGQRTYENVSASEFGFWQRTMIPEARFIATELTEQLLPLFPGEADLVEFDFADVPVLQEAERARWATDKEQIAAGVMTINEWRDEKGKSKLPYGDVWWAPVNLVPVNSGEDLILPQGASVVADKGDAALPPGETPPRMIAASTTRAVAYGSPEHEAAYRAHVRQTDRHERRVADVTADLFRRQKKSVLSRLRRDRTALSTREAAEVFDEPFEMAKWRKTFQQTIKPVLTEVVQDIGTDALVSMGLSIAFDVKQPHVMRAIERQAQQFAQRINDTTWDALRTSLSEGINNGESIDALAARVEDVMGDRIRSSGEVIARTEVNRASSTGDIESWRQTGVVAGKRWNAALDDRTRATHVEAHGQQVRLDDDFSVGSATGPGPGLMGVAKEDVQCRCYLTPILDVEWVEP